MFSVNNPVRLGRSTMAECGRGQPVRRTRQKRAEGPSFILATLAYAKTQRPYGESPTASAGVCDLEAWSDRTGSRERSKTAGEIAIILMPVFLGPSVRGRPRRRPALKPSGMGCSSSPQWSLLVFLDFTLTVLTGRGILTTSSMSTRDMLILYPTRLGQPSG